MQKINKRIDKGWIRLSGLSGSMVKMEYDLATSTALIVATGIAFIIPVILFPQLVMVPSRWFVG
jgi:hypothetical protein